MSSPGRLSIPRGAPWVSRVPHGGHGSGRSLSQENGRKTALNEPQPMCLLGVAASAGAGAGSWVSGRQVAGRVAWGVQEGKWKTGWWVCPASSAPSCSCLTGGTLRGQSPLQPRHLRDLPSQRGALWAQTPHPPHTPSPGLHWALRRLLTRLGLRPLGVHSAGTASAPGCL